MVLDSIESDCESQSTIKSVDAYNEAVFGSRNLLKERFAFTGEATVNRKEDSVSPKMRIRNIRNAIESELEMAKQGRQQLEEPEG